MIGAARGGSSAGRGPAAGRTATDDLRRAGETGPIGVIGGTFDPIHYGHLAIAEEARLALGLRTVLFVPAREPPHKPGLRVSPAEDRVAMVQLAIADNPSFQLCRIEVDRPGPSYTIDTIESLVAEVRATGREPDIVFILSSEALEGLSSWREPQHLASLCRLAVASRADHPMPDRARLDALLPGQADRVVLLNGPHLCQSGSEIRRRASEGRSIRYHLPPDVAAYIVAHRLYAPERYSRP